MKYQNLKTDMRRINYKSDIPPLLLSLKVDENQITVPDCDFIVRSSGRITGAKMAKRVPSG